MNHAVNIAALKALWVEKKTVKLSEVNLISDDIIFMLLAIAERGPSWFMSWAFAFQT